MDMQRFSSGEPAGPRLQHGRRDLRTNQSRQAANDDRDCRRRLSSRAGPSPPRRVGRCPICLFFSGESGALRRRITRCVAVGRTKPPRPLIAPTGSTTIPCVPRRRARRPRRPRRGAWRRCRRLRSSARATARARRRAMTRACLASRASRASCGRRLRRWWRWCVRRSFFARQRLRTRGRVVCVGSLNEREGGLRRQS